MRHAPGRHGPWLSRRGALALLVGAAAGLHPFRRARASAIEVPIPIQIELMTRVLRYDRNAAARMGDRGELLILRRPGDPESTRGAIQARAELGRVAELVGAPLRVTEHAYVDRGKLMQTCDENRTALVLLMPGLSDVVPDLAQGFAGKNILTVSLLADDVPRGIVLGFTLVSSRPAILIHLAQARRQGVDFSARLLALAEVVP